MRRVTPRKTSKEPTIALINVVFLMLVFFLLAGTIAKPLDGGLELVETAELDGAEPPDALVLHADGRVTFRGEAIDPAAFDAEGDKLRLVPDRNLPASKLLDLAAQLSGPDIADIVVVAERSQPE